MRNGDWAANLSALHESSRHGAIKVATLTELGVSPRTAYRRCVPGGPWQRPLPGLVLLTNSPPTRRQLVEAALLYAGPDAIVTGLEACRRHGLRTPTAEESVHLLVREDRKVHGSDYVIVERTRRLPDPVVVDGLPLAPLSRAVLDASRRLRAFDPVRGLIAEAVQRGRLHPGWLLHELDRGSQRGSAVPREVLGDLAAGARSVAEIDAMGVWKRTGLPPLQWNVTLFDSSGKYVAKPDGWADEVGLAWEIDSFEYHFQRADYARTIERNTRYAAAGVALVQTLPARLRSEPDTVAAELAAAYRAAGARPRPPVEVRMP